MYISNETILNQTFSIDTRWLVMVDMITIVALSVGWELKSQFLRCCLETAAIDCPHCLSVYINVNIYE